MDVLCNQLYFATQQGDYSSVVTLIQNTDVDVDCIYTDGYTPLTLACINKHPYITKFLIRHGANVNHILGTGYSVLMQTLTSNDPTAKLQQIVQLLIDNGADINYTDSYGYNALLFASYFNHPECIQLLLNKGASINHTNKDGNTALIIAVKEGRVDVVRILLNYCPDLSIKNKQGKSATDIAKQQAVYGTDYSTIYNLLNNKSWIRDFFSTK